MPVLLLRFEGRPVNRRQHLRFRFWRAAADPRVWAAISAVLLVTSSMLSCWTLYDTKRSLCEQRVQSRAEVRALAVSMVDEVSKPPVKISPEAKADLIHRAENRARRQLPPPDC